jgi:hypothetical protein
MFARFHPSRYCAAVSASAAVLLLCVAGTASAAAPKVRSVGDPPRSAKNHFKVAVSANAPKVALYLSTDRLVGRADRRLAVKGRLKHGKGKLTVSLPKSLAPNAYFLLACPGKSRHGCASSRTPMVLAPSTPMNFPTTTFGVDSSRATAGTVGKSGGSISATAGDGTHFDLTVPAQSVPDGTQIMLRPLSTLSTPPRLGRLVAGVTVDTSLASFARGATLTITPSRKVALRNRRAVGFEVSGAVLHEVPFATKQARVVLGVSNPGGYAFTEVGAAGKAGGIAARATVRAGGAGGGGVSAFYEGLLAGLLDQLRATGHDINDGSNAARDYLDAAASVLSDWRDDVMKHEVPPGMKDDAPADVAIEDLNRYVSASALLGFVGSDEAVIPTDYLLANGKYVRAQRRCADNHNLKEIGDNIIPDEQQREFYGGAENSFAEVVKCARFRVQIDSEITLDFQPPPTSGSNHYHHTSTTDVQADPSGQHWRGSAPGTYTDASGSSTTTTFCGSATETRDTTTTITGSDGGTTTISNFRFPFRSNDPDQFILSMGSDASENYHSESTGCGFPDSSSDFTDNSWFNSLVDDHQAIGEGSGGSSVDFHLNPGAGDVIASRSYSLGGETTTVQVLHIPPTP